VKTKLLSLILAVMLLAAVFPVYAAPEATGGTVYVVQAGDTLFSIARRYGVDVNALAQANGIVNPAQIYVGQQLTIPGSAAAPAPGGSAAPATSGGAYVVQPGDTMYSIAARYNTTPWAIAQANGIYNTNYIYVGQQLIIPGLAPATPAKPATTTPSTGSGGGWRGEYYSGTETTGGALFARNDRAINFRWGMASPDTRLNTDKFAVHWTQTINFRGGLYRFQITADDGVRLWVDGTPVLDEWRAQNETVYERDVVLTPGNHLIALDYFDDAGAATIQFTFKRLGNAPTNGSATPVAGQATPTPVGGGAAPADSWLGQYFGNDKLEGAPVVTRYDASVNFDWGLAAPVGGIPDNYFSVRWTRSAWFYEDNYLFCMRADDGARFYVDGVMVINEWHGSNGGTGYCAEVDMTKGNHVLVAEYYEDGANALVQVWWERR